MKRAKNTGQLKAQCSAIMAAAVNGTMDLKKARAAISAAHAIVRLHEAETLHITSMLRAGQDAPKINHAPLHDDEDDPDVIAIGEASKPDDPDEK